jgi:hypothetical protein
MISHCPVRWAKDTAENKKPQDFLKSQMYIPRYFSIKKAIKTAILRLGGHTDALSHHTIWCI